MIINFLCWFFGVWLFPLVPLWFVISLADGEPLSMNPLKWDTECRMWLSVWTIVTWLVGAFVLVLLLLPGK